MASTKEASNAKKEDDAEVIEDDEDDEEIDDEQLEEYRDMVEKLGNFPDKVKIASLSMVAEDFSESKKGSRTIYNVIRERILKVSQREKLLPLVYLVDSIVKNAKGQFVKIVEDDAEQWMSHVYQQLAEPQKAKLQRVVKMWGDANLFDAQKIKIMGRCFDKGSNAKINNTTSTEVAGISRTGDGSLILSSALRQEMQNILDDMQRDVNEVDKISLERLAQINPNLLAKVKKTALEGLGNGGGRPGNITGNGNQSSGGGKDSETHIDENSFLPSFLTETRSPQQIQRTKAWADISQKTMEGSPGLVTDLQDRIQKCGETQYTQQDALDMTQYLAVASATAQLLTNTLERIKKETDQKRNAILMTANAASAAQIGFSNVHGGLVIDPNDFTNEGVKNKNPSVISMLYEVGLPFVSSADGRRFRTQLELSKHLDGLFKRNQLEKSIAKTEERGWYDPDIVWAGEAMQQDAVQDDDPLASTTNKTKSQTADADAGDGYSPETSTVPADEARDRCVICGINFRMFFDNDDGIYKYGNCREIELVNDDIALDDSEQTLVHVTCWRGLGSPSELNMDQVLHDN